MLANEEILKGVDREKVFAKMVQEMPWMGLVAYIQSNAQLQKLCSMGGFRMIPEKRQRLEKLLLDDVRRNNYSEVACSGVFSAWYPKHAALHKSLEDYFHSDEYKAYRTEKGLTEDDYVLTDEKFNEFFNTDERSAWTILLLYSPLKFTDEQGKKIVNRDEAETADLTEKVRQLESAEADLRKKLENAQADLEKLRSAAQNDSNEMQAARRDLRQAREEAEKAGRDLEAARNEMRRANDRARELQAKLDEQGTVRKEEVERELNAMKARVEEANNEVVLWRTRHEQQCQENHNLEDMALQADKRCAQMKAERDEFEQKVLANRQVIDRFLERIDWKLVASTLKPSPYMKRNFQSLLQNLNYDADRNLTLEGTLPVFWNRMQAVDQQLIDALVKSSERELMNGSIQDYWNGLKNQFAAVQNSLEAREALLGILKDIFYETYKDEDISANATFVSETTNAAVAEEINQTTVKPEVKKAPAKKTAAKKTAAKSGEKAPAKKPAAKTTTKTVAKKPATKKPAAKAAVKKRG